MSKQVPLHPSLQEAIDTRTECNVDGDYYQQTIDAIIKAGYAEAQAMSYKKGTVGTRLFNKESIAEVSLADFIGTFTDIQFRKKSNTPSKKR